MNIEALECMLAAGKDGALLRFGLGKGWLDAGNPVRAATRRGGGVVLDAQYAAAWKLLGMVSRQTSTLLRFLVARSGYCMEARPICYRRKKDRFAMHIL